MGWLEVLIQLRSCMVNSKRRFSMHRMASPLLPRSWSNTDSSTSGSSRIYLRLNNTDNVKAAQETATQIQQMPRTVSPPLLGVTVDNHITQVVDIPSCLLNKKDVCLAQIGHAFAEGASVHFQVGSSLERHLPLLRHRFVPHHLPPPSHEQTRRPRP